MVMVQRLSFLLAVLPILVACGHDDVETCAGDPAIHHLSFTPETVVAGGDLAGSVSVMHFSLTGDAGHHDDEDGAHPENLGPSPQDSDSGHDEGACPTGHVHVYLDDLMSNPLTQATTSEFVITIPMDTVAGAHTLMGRLHNSDHTILEPQVISEVDITVEDPPTP